MVLVIVRMSSSGVGRLEVGSDETGAEKLGDEGPGLCG